MTFAQRDAMPMVPALRAFVLYTAILVSGTALFFFLHHLGNQLPYEQAKQRFSDDFAASLPKTGSLYVQGFNSPFTYCQIALAVMAGAQEVGRKGAADGSRPLVDAVLPRQFNKEIAPDSNYCAEVKAVSGGMALGKSHLKTRYWWGSKAVFAIALHGLSVFEIHQILYFASYGAYVFLAGTLLLSGWRVLLIAAPLIVFGAFFSGVPYFADVENGIPYIWALLAAAVLALLLWRRRSMRTMRVFCFTTGMVSSYLWLFDGHNFLLIVLIGLIGWFGHEQPSIRDRARQVGGYMALYIAGFVLCFALGQATKAVVYEQEIAGGHDYVGGWVARNFLGQASFHMGRIVSPQKRDLKGKHIGTFAKLASIGPRGQEGWYLVGSSMLALLFATAVACIQVRRGRSRLGSDMLWFFGLMLLTSCYFILPNDLPFRSARFMFMLFALCWSSLFLSSMQISRPLLFVTIGGFLTIFVPWGIMNVNAMTN